MRFSRKKSEKTQPTDDGRSDASRTESVRKLSKRVSVNGQNRLRRLDSVKKRPMVAQRRRQSLGSLLSEETNDSPRRKDSFLVRLSSEASSQSKDSIATSGTDDGAMSVISKQERKANREAKKEVHRKPVDIHAFRKRAPPSTKRSEISLRETVDARRIFYPLVPQCEPEDLHVALERVVGNRVLFVELSPMTRAEVTNALEMVTTIENDRKQDRREKRQGRRHSNLASLAVPVSAPYTTDSDSGSSSSGSESDSSVEESASRAGSPTQQRRNRQREARRQRRRDHATHRLASANDLMTFPVAATSGGDAQMQFASVQLDSSHAKSRLLASRLAFRGTDLFALASALDLDRTKYRANRQKLLDSADRGRRQVRLETKLRVQIAEHGEMYGSNPLNLRSIHARRALAMPGAHPMALAGSAEVLEEEQKNKATGTGEGDIGVEELDEKRAALQRTIRRQHTRKAKQEALLKLMEDTTLYEGPEAAKRLAEKINREHDSEEELAEGDSDDEDRCRATRAYISVPGAAVLGNVTELQDELFETVADNDPVRLDALLKEYRMVNRTLFEEKRKNVDLRASIAARERAERKRNQGRDPSLLISATDPSTRALQSLSRGAVGSNLLHWAAQHGAKECIPRLLQEHIKVDSRDELGNTPVHYAIINSRPHVLEYLIQRGARINAHGFNGNSPLHFAAGKGNVPLVRQLLSLGAALDEENTEGATPLDLAVTEGHKDCIAVIIARLDMLRKQRARQAEEAFHTRMFD